MKKGHVHSVMEHNFSKAPQANIPRSSFNRDHGCKTTFDAGYLIPILVDEALPGDTYNVKMTGFARMATPIVPFMDNLFMDTHFFAVPYRLVWDNWQKFNGEQINPGDSTDFVIPTIAFGVGGMIDAGTVGDYMGLPTAVASLDNVSALFFRAYNLIWNEWFRDENLQNSVTVPLDDGPDPIATYSLLKRGKRYDYFTSCLPFPQKGPAVSLPLGTQAPVTGLGWVQSGSVMLTGSSTVIESTGLTTNYPYFTASGIGTIPIVVQATGTTATTGPNVFADLSAATAATINQLREAFQIQKLYERDARGGTRYIEVLKSHFGVTSPDSRLQRPEYLGGGSTPVIVNPVAQTSSTDSTTPQANLSAFATSTLKGHGFTKSFVEHCIIIGLVSVRADLNYQQGMHRMWNRQTRFDFYWPALSHIGEQAVLNQEIYAQGTPTDLAVFGYQERFAEYRYKPSIVTGQFRSNFATPLDIWHLSQDFGSLPVLNDSFIQENPPIARVIATPTYPAFLFDSWFSMKCARPMPVYSVPGLVDHF